MRDQNKSPKKSRNVLSCKCPNSKEVRSARFHWPRVSARATGLAGPSRSVVGTIDIDPADSMLENADADVRALFDASLGRPFIARESSPPYGAASKKKKSRG